MPSEKTNVLAQAKRETMVDIAIGVIAEGGIKALTFRRLADVAGTSTAPFTTEFGTREELLKAVVEKCWLDLSFDRQELAGADPLESLEAVLLRAVPAADPVAPELRAYLDLLVAATHDPVLGEKLQVIERERAPDYEELITNAQVAGFIPESKDPRDLLASLWALSDGLLLAYAIDPETFPPSRVKELWEASFAALIA